MRVFGFCPRFPFGNQLSFSLPEYTRASITWRAEPQSSTPLTSLHGPTPALERKRRWLWATLSCHPPACKKVGGEPSGFCSPGGSPMSTTFWWCKTETPVTSALGGGNFLLLGVNLPPWMQRTLHLLIVESQTGWC